MTAGPRTLFGKVATLSGAGEREQTVFTPASILAVPRALWGGRIAYDSCHGHAGVVLTKIGRWAAKEAQCPGGKPMPPPEQWVEMELATRVESQVNAERWTDCDGLTQPWVDGTFANVPFGSLAEWLAMSLEQRVDHVMLVPVRPHRKCWRKWAREMELVYLNPVTFVGHDQSFPAPLCLARWHWGRDGEMTRVCEMLGLGEAL